MTEKTIKEQVLEALENISGSKIIPTKENKFRFHDLILVIDLTEELARADERKKIIEEIEKRI